MGREQRPIQPQCRQNVPQQSGATLLCVLQWGEVSRTRECKLSSAVSRLRLRVDVHILGIPKPVARHYKCLEAVSWSIHCNKSIVSLVCCSRPPWSRPLRVAALLPVSMECLPNRGFRYPAIKATIFAGAATSKAANKEYVNPILIPRRPIGISLQAKNRRMLTTTTER